MMGNGHREDAGWIAFFDRRNGVGDALLARKETEQYVTMLTAHVPFNTGARVLEFGCAYGFAAQALARRVAEVLLWDPAASKQQVARANLAGCRNARFLDLADPEALSGNPLGVDLILVNSVVQYMQADEFLTWLSRWRGMLAPGGRVVLSDIIPPDHSHWGDGAALIQFSLRAGCFVAAIRDVLGEARFYWRTRRQHPLYQIAPDGLREAGAARGFTVEFLPRNLTHFPNRLTAVFTVAGD